MEHLSQIAVAVIGGVLATVIAAFILKRLRLSETGRNITLTKTITEGEKERWTAQTFLQRLWQRRSGGAETAVVNRILEWTARFDRPVEWGNKKSYGEFWVGIKTRASEHWLFSVCTDGFLYVLCKWGLEETAAFSDEARRRELLSRLNEVSGVDLPLNAASGHPNNPRIALTALAGGNALHEFLTTIDWAIEMIDASSQSAG